MFRIIRYIIILILIMLGLFFLDQKSSWFQSRVDYVKLFFLTIGNDGNLSQDKIFDDINKDFGGSSNGFSTTTIVKSTTNKNTNDQSPVDFSNNSKISIDGVIYYTNLERTKNGLKPLSKNTKLVRSATDKVDDMFSLQYFEHISPKGESVSDVVKENDYKFQIVGENLALGIFNTDKALVQAWMDSPSHRENILNPKYTEIGVAVAIGEYKNQRQWMAVQHFAKPLPICPEVDEQTQININTDKTNLENEARDLQKMAGIIESDPTIDRGYIDDYNKKVSDYNIKLNNLRETIDLYNQTIVKYNECLKNS